MIPLPETLLAPEASTEPSAVFVTTGPSCAALPQPAGIHPRCLASRCGGIRCVTIRESERIATLTFRLLRKRPERFR